MALGAPGSGSRPARVEIAVGPGVRGDVGRLDRFDGEARLLQQGRDVSIQLAASTRKPLHAIETILPARHPCIW